MPNLDIFQSNAFSMASLTAAVNKMPYQPNFLGALGVFTPAAITTTVAHVEERRGTLSLIQTAARGTMGDVRSRPQRQVRAFSVPHVPYYSTIMADDVQNIRQFGNETALETVGSVVNDTLEEMRADHEATHEFHRIGCIKGTVDDADGTDIYNYFTDFGITQDTISDVTFASVEMKDVASEIIRNISNALGGTPFKKIIGVCGDDFFDGLVTCPTVEAGYERWQSSNFFRSSQLGPEYNADMNGFDFGGITWVNYRGSIGTTTFVGAGDCYLFPVGVRGLFLEIMAPADFMETVNTRGRKLYAKQRRLDFDKGIEMHTQSNILYMCTRPQVLQTVSEA